ncbi:hypothetical protein ACN20G_00665 [Streptomyces sp. BI20]|uniref:hypothetical protein n=1 Tax=Streptomyces sp. BI20 TaxID=3403460 RepID=UPI003C78C758
MPAHPPHPVPDRPGAPTALLITGTVGVGKTTAADLLGDLLADAGIPHAVIDLDRLRGFRPAPPDDPFGHRLLVDNLRAVAARYTAAGARHLVLAGVAENAAERDDLRAAIGMPLRVCRLTADLPAVHDRLGRRHAADHDLASLPWHVERAGELARVLDATGPADAIVDTTALRPAEVAAAVLADTGWLAPA